MIDLNSLFFFLFLLLVSGGWEDYQSPNMGYSRAGAIQSHYICVSLAPECSCN